MKSLQKLGYTVLGAALALTVVTTAPAVAAQLQTITATLNSINIEVNGQKVAVSGENYTLDNGKQTAGSIVYNETTYVPIRKFGEIMGAEIGWNQETGSVTVVGEATPTTTPAPDTTASTNYSDWSEEEEAAYQEFKGMWEVSFTKLDEVWNIEHYEANYIGDGDSSVVLNAFSELNRFALRLSEEYFNPEHQLFLVFIAPNQTGTNVPTQIIGSSKISHPDGKGSDWVKEATITP